MQKLIQCAQTEEEFVLIASNLRPYTPPLLLNDCQSRSRSEPHADLPLVGNYVVQGALRFGSPAADFVFDAMVDRIWFVSLAMRPRMLTGRREIGSGRFGARSARQILETPNVSSLQIVRLVWPSRCSLLTVLAETSRHRHPAKLDPAHDLGKRRAPPHLASRLVEPSESIPSPRLASIASSCAPLHAQARGGDDP